MFFVYILESERNGRHYVGYTRNLKERLARHNNGMVRSTRNRGPWKIIHKESYQEKSEAIKRERHLKSLVGSPEKMSILRGVQ